MVSRVNGRYIVHIPRAERTYPAPVPHYIFSIEDGRLHYDAQVEQDHPQEQVEEEEVPEPNDEVEQEEGPEQEEQPHYTTYRDISELEGNITNMNNLTTNLQDTSYNLSQKFASWNPMGMKVCIIQHHNDSRSGLAKA
jgi:hypothetical protein